MINPFKSKKGLGRGLSSLIGDSDIKDSKSNITIGSIVRNKYQPRKNFEKKNFRRPYQLNKRERHYPAHYCKKVR